MKLKQFSIVTVPFPFSDSTKSKKRPALVISNQSSFDSKIKHSVLAMVTSSKNSRWPLDVVIKDLRSAGLPASSVVRMKFFTLDHRLVLSIKGVLSENDQLAVIESINNLLKSDR